jgi:hypothetical protein
MAKLFPKLYGASIGATGFGGGPAPNGEPGRAEIGLQKEFLVPSLARIRQKGKLRQSLFELRFGLGHGRARRAPLAGPCPIIHRLVVDPRFAIVLRQQFRLPLHHFRSLFEQIGDARV